MTKKTEMVSVPRELLLRLLSVYSTSPYPAWHELAAALEAAPAEDVRAVGEEPVGQWSDDEGISWCDGNESSLQSARESGWMTRTLYSHPERPVVLPRALSLDRKVNNINYNQGWNACIDEFERLNK